MKRVLIALSTLAFSGVALADEVAELRPTGATAITFRGKPATITKPTTVSLKAGDQICVTSGKLDLLRGTSKQKYTLEKGRCLQVSPPASDGQSVMTFVQSLVNNPKTFDNQGAMSRGGDCKDCAGPALQVPKDFALSELLLPVSGRPNPKTLRLMDTKGTVLYSSTSNADEAVFAIPTAKLLKAARLEVRNASHEMLYGANVYISDFGGKAPASPTEAARRLLATGNAGYAPAAYSYLVKAGSTDERAQLETFIRANFVG
jgi:hypothetical protein